MPLNAWLFVLTFLVLLVLSFRRPSWAVALYMLTFFLAPPFWWWGDSLTAIRWNLLGGVVLLSSVVLTGAASDSSLFAMRSAKRLFLIAMLIAINGTLVHFLLAPNATISMVRYSVLIKSMLLFALMIASIRSEQDVRVFITAIVIGATYIGYEVTFNERGRISGNRLEGVGVANASTANDLACLMTAVVPLIGPIFLTGRWPAKIFAMFAGPLILNVLLMCNSRGAFLSLCVAGGIYVLFAPKRLRSMVLKIACLGLVAGWMLLGDPRIIERFMTTFSDSAELDNSATSRFDFWKAGMLMIGDRPLGSGGNAFRNVYGSSYIRRVTGEEVARSVHQGYINEACDWGVQGLALRLALLLGGLWLSFRGSRRAIHTEQWFLAVVCLSVLASLVGIIVQSLFGTFLDSEWALWLIAIAVGCCHLIENEERKPAVEATDGLQFNEGERVSADWFPGRSV